MKTKNKLRIISIVIAGVMLFGSLAGCAKKDELETYKTAAKLELDTYAASISQDLYSEAQHELAIMYVTQAKEKIDMATDKENVDKILEEEKKDIYPVWWQDEKYANYTQSELYDETMRRGYHIPTIEEDFKDDIVTVFLKSEYSKTNGEFDEDEFRKISQNFASIINTSEEDIANLMADLFRQKIKITLKETGKEKVIEAVAALMEMDMVLIAMPEYIYHAQTLAHNPNITE